MEEYRLGMISSEDTHARYVGHVVRHGDNPHDIDLSDTVVATLDNLDFQHLYIAEINIIAGMACYNSANPSARASNTTCK